MAGSAKARAGIPISAKLILTTSVVVALAVAAATWFSQHSIAELSAEQLHQRRTSGEAAISRQAALAAESIGNASAHAIANNQYSDIPPELAAAVREDQAGVHQLQWISIADATGAIIGATPGAPASAKLAELDQLLPAGAGVAHARVGTGADWIYSAPIKIAGNTIGKVRLGVTSSGLEAELAKSLAEADDAAQASRRRLLVIALVVLGIGVIAAGLQSMSIARPIRVLTTQANRIAMGDFSMRVPATRRDELGVLARTFNFMSDAMVQLLAANAQKASLEKEMELARQVQQAMLPPAHLDQHGYFKVIGYCMPASQCGGDWWMYRKLSNGRMLLVLGDATGHGIHSAMIAATARGAVEALAAVAIPAPPPGAESAAGDAALTDERLLTPYQVLRAIDQAIAMVGEHNVLMTAFAAVFDSQTGVLHYANAGQNFPYVIKLGHTRVLEDASIIAASGNPLGDRNIQVEIRRGTLQLRPGDLFVLFSDGVVERANRAGKLFGDRRLRSALTGQPLPDSGALIQLRDKVLAALDRHAEGLAAEDDVTFVLCQYDPPAQRASGRGNAA
ncbi:MAG: SpoIIE family protein phosphatase [Kofleriaceae bacterium]